MESEKSKYKNNYNSTNNNINNPNINSPQNYFNDTNNQQFQSIDNIQYINFNNVNNNNYYFDPNIQPLFNQNAYFNNINNEQINNNNYRNNNNYYQNINSKEKSERKNSNKGNPKRINYMPKKLILNQNNQNTNIPVPNYPQMPFLNYYNNNPNTIQPFSPEPLYDKNFNSNYCNANDIDNNFRKIITEINNDQNDINKKETSGKFSSIYSYIFNSDIEEVVDMLSNEDFFKNICPSDIIDNVHFPKQTFSEPGEKILSLRWKKFYNVKLVSSNYHWRKTNISFTLTAVELKPEDIGSLKMNFKYYYNTCQNNTLFIMECILDNSILSEVFKEEFIDSEMNAICSCAEQYMSQRKKEKSHITSIMINSSKEKVWNNIIFLNKKRFINYMNKYDLYYIFKDELENISDENNNINKNKLVEDNNKDYHMQKGDGIIIIKSENKNKIFSKIIIEDIKEEKDKNEIILKFYNKEQSQEKNDNDEENLEILNQKIIFTIKEITKDICYFEFKHIWEDWVNINKINSLDLLKVNSLKIFKAKEENETNPNKKADDNSVLNILNLLCPSDL